MKVGIIQQSNSSDVAENRRRISEEVRRLAAGGAQLIVNRELHDSLYFCQEENTANFDLAVAIPGEATDFYGNLAKEAGVVLVTSLLKDVRRDCTTILPWYLSATALSPANTARCTSPTTLLITKNSTSPPVTLTLSP